MTKKRAKSKKPSRLPKGPAVLAAALVLGGCGPKKQARPPQPPPQPAPENPPPPQVAPEMPDDPPPQVREPETQFVPSMISPFD